MFSLALTNNLYLHKEWFSLSKVANVVSHLLSVSQFYLDLTAHQKRVRLGGTKDGTHKQQMFA